MRNGTGKQRINLLLDKYDPLPYIPRHKSQGFLTHHFLCLAQFVQFTTSCRQHFAHVGRALIKLRIDAEKPPKENYADRKRRMTEHVKSHMDKMCCAEMPDGTEKCEARFCIIHVRRTMAKRATHIARKMTEAKHPSAVEHFDVATQATGTHRHTRALPNPRAQSSSTDALLICATQVGIDVVNPDLHPDPACRVSNHSSDVAKMECMGKSILHHTAQQHGYDVETMQAKLDEAGINVGEGLMKMAKTLGYVREGRGPVKSAFFEKQAKDEASASTLMRESRKRMEAAKQGRKLAQEAGDEAFGSSHGLGQHALQAGALRRQLHNASGVMHRGMMAIDRAATKVNNVQSRGASARIHAPHPDTLDWHAARNSVPSPLTTLLAVSAEEGSLASRFGNGIMKLNALRDRASGALHTTRRRLQEHDAGLRRRLSPNAAHANALFEALERSHAESPPKRRALELPERHALSWVHVRLAFNPLECAHARPISAHPPPRLFRSSSTGTRRSTRGRGCTASCARGTSCARRARRTPRSSSGSPRGTTTSTTRTTRAPPSWATRCAACCTARRRAPTRRGTSRPC
tara:strand:- start:342 stop:2072 length:1731 start_codon:yes stop_codon:yes gene_type:complete